MLLILSKELLFVLMEFLGGRERQALKSSHSSFDKEMDNKLGYLFLNTLSTAKYVFHPPFRHEVLHRISDPKKQISLKFSVLEHSINEDIIALLKNVDSIHLQQSTLELAYGMTGQYRLQYKEGEGIGHLFTIHKCYDEKIFIHKSDFLMLLPGHCRLYVKQRKCLMQFVLNMPDDMFNYLLDV